MCMQVLRSKRLDLDDDGVANSCLMPVGLGREEGAQQEIDREGPPCDNVRLDAHGQQFLARVHGFLHQRFP